jgi:RNA-directed DNA polymerase
MSTSLTADDATLVASFAKLRTLDDIASLLDVTSRELRFYLYKANRYRRFQIPKKSGGIRNIYSPDNALKIIQRKLNQVLHAVYKGRASVHGFARRKSIRSNAQRHVGCKLLLNFDLADFFPSVHFGRVKGMCFRPYHTYSLNRQPWCLPRSVATTARYLLALRLRLWLQTWSVLEWTRS